MIKDLDLTLEKLIQQEATTGTELHGVAHGDPNKISFSVPDQSWRDNISGPNLNIYLYDIRENRQLRTNEPIMKTGSISGTEKMVKPPVRIDCSYMISAWNTVADSGNEDTEMQEHRLLSQTLQVLLRNPLIPEDYLLGLLINLDEELELPDLPMISAQKNTLSNPVEFWNALGTPYRPSINCVVTVSMDVNHVITDNIYTVTESDIDFKESEKMIQGTIVDSVDQSTGISWAQVMIPELNKSTTADINGNFALKDILHSERGYEFFITAEGYIETKPTIVIPEPSGDYTITMTLKA